MNHITLMTQKHLFFYVSVLVFLSTLNLFVFKLVAGNPTCADTCLFLWWFQVNVRTEPHNLQWMFWYLLFILIIPLFIEHFSRKSSHIFQYSFMNDWRVELYPANTECYVGYFRSFAYSALCNALYDNSNYISNILSIYLSIYPIY
jgi:hypothetical protein